MNNLIDFTNCEENLKTYNGANGSKLGIIFKPLGRNPNCFSSWAECHTKH